MSDTLASIFYRARELQDRDLMEDTAKIVQHNTVYEKYCSSNVARKD